jgi:hypothetical protein
MIYCGLDAGTMSVGTDTTIHRRQSLSPSLSFVVPRFCLAAAATTSRLDLQHQQVCLFFLVVTQFIHYVPIHFAAAAVGRPSLIGGSSVGQGNGSVVIVVVVVVAVLVVDGGVASSVLENPAFSQNRRHVATVM